MNKSLVITAAVAALTVSSVNAGGFSWGWSAGIGIGFGGGCVNAYVPVTPCYTPVVYTPPTPCYNQVVYAPAVMPTAPVICRPSVVTYVPPSMPVGNCYGYGQPVGGTVWVGGNGGNGHGHNHSSHHGRR